MKKHLNIFSTSHCARIVTFAVAMTACGGGAPAKTATVPGSAPTTPAPSTSPAASSAPAPGGDPSAEGDVRASTVRFDDIGISVVIPPGFRAIGDGEFAARVRASSNPKTLDVIRRSMKQRKSFPLLTLSRDGEGWVSVTFSLVGVPNDVRAEELINQQREIMTTTFDDFKVTSAAQNFMADGVDSSRLECRYRLRDRNVVSSLRVHVRQGMALLVSAMHGPDASDSAARAAAVLEGIHFYPAVP